jgi:hypothetical protein
VIDELVGQEEEQPDLQHKNHNHFYSSRGSRTGRRGSLAPTSHRGCIRAPRCNPARRSDYFDVQF